MILNLTQHTATSDQLEAGVVEPANKARDQRLITFDDQPTSGEIRERAVAVAAIAASSGHTVAMIGGAPFFMAPLEVALKERGILPLYSFTRRISLETPDGKGGVNKAAAFRHVGFVPAFSML